MKIVSTARFLLRVGVGVVVVIEVVLGLGVLLQVLDANPEASFTDWSYRNQDRLMTAFEGTFDDTSIGDSDAVVDVSGLLAMAVYGVLFIPLAVGLRWTRRVQHRIEDRRREEAEAARQALLFGTEPEVPEPVDRTGVLGRLRSKLERRRARATPAEDE